MKRYFLTGCTGFIGTAIVRELCKRDDTESITLLTRNPQARYGFYEIDKRISFYVGNIVDCMLPKLSLIDMDFTHIIHGSNESQLAEPHSNYYAMVEGTNRLLDWVFGTLNRGGGMVPEMLFLSSGAASEGATSYGQGKRVSEKLVEQTRFGKIARIYTLIGENTPPQYAAGLFIRQAIQDGEVTVKGGARAIRSYLHTEDCARWLLEVLKNGRSERAYDIGSKTPYYIKDVAHLVAEVFGVPLRVIDDASEEPNVYLPDTSGAVELGLQETISLKQALESIRDDYRIRNSHLETPAAA